MRKYAAVIAIGLASGAWWWSAKPSRDGDVAFASRDSVRVVATVDDVVQAVPDAYYRLTRDAERLERLGRLAEADGFMLEAMRLYGKSRERFLEGHRAAWPDGWSGPPGSCPLQANAIWGHRARLSERMGDSEGSVWNLRGVAAVAWYRRDYARAVDHYRRTAELGWKLGRRNQKTAAADDYVAIGRVLIERGDPGDRAAAAQAFAQAEVMHRQLGNEDKADRAHWRREALEDKVEFDFGTLAPRTASIRSGYMP